MSAPLESVLPISPARLRSARWMTLLRLAFAFLAVILPIRACVIWREAGEDASGWVTSPSALWIVLGLFALSWGLGGRLLVLPAIGAVIDHQERMRQEVFLPLMREAFPGVRHDPARRFDQALYAASGIYSGGDSPLFQNEDGVYSAELDGRSLLAGELFVQVKVGYDGYKSFRGFFATFNLREPLDGRVILDPRKAPFPTTGKRDGLVETSSGDAEIDRRYRIHASEAGLVPALLTPERRAALVALHDEPGAPCAAAFTGDRGFVAEQSGEPLLHDNVFVSWSEDRLESVRRTLRATAALIRVAP